MAIYRFSILFFFLIGNLQAQENKAIKYPISCEGLYQEHLQGITTNGEAIFWSFTDTLVKTDLKGKIIRKIPVDDHHGDLCYADNKVYVAVNLGQFNQPAGLADSWVYVYDVENLNELNRYPVPELVHGAGGMAVKDNVFYIVGGLPEDIGENYVYRYTSDFEFKERYIISSGHTHLGIQTVDFINDAWYLGCYGEPRILIKTDPEFKILGQWKFDAALGITSLPDGQILVARGYKKEGLNGGEVVKATARTDDGLLIEK